MFFYDIYKLMSMFLYEIGKVKANVLDIDKMKSMLLYDFDKVGTNVLV